MRQFFGPNTTAFKDLKSDGEDFLKVKKNNRTLVRDFKAGKGLPQQLPKGKRINDIKLFFAKLNPEKSVLPFCKAGKRMPAFPWQPVENDKNFIHKIKVKDLKPNTKYEVIAKSSISR